LTEDDLKNLCNIDYLTKMALVAEAERNGGKEIIGVGRYIKLPFDHTAEVAFIVQDSEQNKGLGTQLLKHLAQLAWQQEIYFFFGEVLRQNYRMLSIFKKSDPGMKLEVDGPTTCNITLSIAEAMQKAY
jgi:GNAT superfamily N-acetyltransferase